MLFAEHDDVPLEIPKKRLGSFDAIESTDHFPIKSLLGDITACIKRIQCVCETIVKYGQTRNFVRDLLL